MAAKVVPEDKVAMVVSAGQVPAGACFSRQEILSLHNHLSILTARLEVQEPTAVWAESEAMEARVVTEAMVPSGLMGNTTCTEDPPAHPGDRAGTVAGGELADPAEAARKGVPAVLVERGRVVGSMWQAERSSYPPIPSARTALKEDAAASEVGAVMGHMLVQGEMRAMVVPGVLVAQVVRSRTSADQVNLQVGPVDPAVVVETGATAVTVVTGRWGTRVVAAGQLREAAFTSAVGR